jgi:hypothetical protein
MFTFVKRSFPFSQYTFLKIGFLFLMLAFIIAVLAGVRAFDRTGCDK